MAKEPIPQSTPFPVRQNETTAGPNYVRTFTNDPDFEGITRAVVLSRVNGADFLRVFRKSTTASGLFSCDLYDRSGEGGGWKRIREEKEKYEQPQIPRGAKHTRIEDVDFFTLEEMTADKKRALSMDLRRLLGRE
jgi:hypothetical protein